MRELRTVRGWLTYVARESRSRADKVEERPQVCLRKRPQRTPQVLDVRVRLLALLVLGCAAEDVEVDSPPSADEFFELQRCCVRSN